MTDPYVRQALLEHVSAQEPGLGLTAEAVIRTGRRSLARRRLASGAGAIALVGAVAAAVAVLPGLRWANGLGDSASPPTCSRETVPRASIAVTPGGPAAASGGPQYLADQMTCYLLDAVPAAFPGATFSNLRSAPYLVAVPDEAGFSATAVVSTSAGQGSLIFAVSQVTAPPPQLVDPAPQCGKATCRTGPHGERVEVFDFGADTAGVHGRTIYLFSGHTRILAGAHNVSQEVDGAEPTMTDPPLSVDQLIALASDPRLVLYP
jgi:hypothetical protein